MKILQRRKFLDLRYAAIGDMANCFILSVSTSYPIGPNVECFVQLQKLLQSETAETVLQFYSHLQVHVHVAYEHKVI